LKHFVEILSNIAYYLAWLAAGLALIAAASAAIARQLRLRVLRRAKAAHLLDALASYSDWIAAQRRATYFQGEPQEDDSPLQDVRTIQRGWFPELSDEAAQLFEVHAHLIDFLWAQQMLRLKDAEAWFESDSDVRFMELWRMHRSAAQAAAEKLKGLAGVAVEGMEDMDGVVHPNAPSTAGVRQ
jgi:hypothetical protein